VIIDAQATTTDRRSVLEAGLTASALLAVPGTVLVAGAGTAAASPPRGALFSLGVASGEPTPDGMVLCTLLAPDPLVRRRPRRHG
jgi:alkaline phosphatase D